MKRIGWAIAVAAAWLTPAAAQAPASSPAASIPAAAQPNAAPPAGSAQNASKPGAATAPQAQQLPAAALPIVAPTPGIGQPDGRMMLQDQVTPIGEEAASYARKVRRHVRWVNEHLRVVAGSSPGLPSAEIRPRPGARSVSLGLEPHDDLGNQKIKED